MPSKIITRSEKESPLVITESEFSPESIDIENRTVKTVFTTERKVLIDPWFDEPYYEILSTDPEHIRLERIDKGIPVLDGHDRSGSVLKQFGIAEGLDLGNENPETLMRFSRKEEALKAFQDIADGIVKTTSIGYRVYKYEDISEDDDKIRTLRAIDWEPFEISLVPIPADIDAQIRSNEPVVELKKPDNDTNNRDIQKGDPLMPKKLENKNPETEVEKVDVEQVRKEATEQERLRSSEIRALVSKVGLDSEIAEDLIKEGKSVEQARELIIDKVAERSEEKAPSTHTPRIEVDSDTNRNAKVEGAAEAILHRNGIVTELSDKGKMFRGFSFLDIAREFTPNFGRGLDRVEIAERALASSDFKAITDNVATKTLEKGYKAQKQTFWPFVKEGFLPDFREAKRVRYGEAPSLLEVKEGGEYKDASFGDKSEGVKLSKHGRVLKITEETILNSDFNVFEDLEMFGSASSRLESNLVYDVLTSNSKMSDGKDLFILNTNKAAASGIEAGLKKMFELFMMAKGMDDKDFLNLTPEYLMVGPDRREEAMKVLKQIVASKSSDVNIYSDELMPIVEPRLNGKGWFTATSKEQAKTIELNFLEGRRGPSVKSSFDGDRDLIKIKIKHIVSAKSINREGLFWNPGN
ncbi:HK97 family phage prohead protease [Halobacteriovorax sp. GB3]|uniref:phage major capsid protein n=1 Tax=Halobacteriovorax sp. GB3 TaxID=2719615 RepID=UPI0023610041|nr:HK97 family phage prohead protease [Halobacteriovorax sp. GB3]MDD0852989.1 HK97 family phage prohead protease [Halobacteriovorax sp. GB3]